MNSKQESNFPGRVDHVCGHPFFLHNHSSIKANQSHYVTQVATLVFIQIELFFFDGLILSALGMVTISDGLSELWVPQKFGLEPTDLFHLLVPLLLCADLDGLLQQITVQMQLGQVTLSHDVANSNHCPFICLLHWLYVVGSARCGMSGSAGADLVHTRRRAHHLVPLCNLLEPFG